jgi:hypothetical protein
MAIAGACERVTATPVRAHTHVAQLALRDALRRRTEHARGAEAAVWRDRRGLRVRLDGIDHLDGSVRGWSRPKSRRHCGTSTPMHPGSTSRSGREPSVVST